MICALSREPSKYHILEFPDVDIPAPHDFIASLRLVKIALHVMPYRRRMRVLSIAVGAAGVSSMGNVQSSVQESNSAVIKGFPSIFSRTITE